jgi:hypothetical protein
MRSSPPPGKSSVKTGDVSGDVAQRCAAQNRRAVVGFLAEHGAVVARRLQFHERKLVISEFEFL